ncbi:PKD domain-containing protein [Anseongella ginsenosidimutans]|nr:PKD domain-containing protein [Anseongella ginsenosidimutans]
MIAIRLARTVRYWGALFLLAAGLELNAQNTTNKGTDFWTTFTSHINVENGEFYPPGLALYITSDVSTSGVVSIPGRGYSDEFTVSPNNITIVQVPFGLSYTGTSEAPEQKGIHISSRDPVVVYSHIYGEKRSGASLVMPSRSLGQEYRAVCYYEDSQFSIIGVESDTWVEITPTALTEAGRPANTPFKIKLQAGDVYQVRSGGDLTGSKITTKVPENSNCKKIAVYSGSMGVRIGCGGQGFDNLYQQLFAYSSWGRDYIAVPMENRPYDILRILAGEQASTVTVNGVSRVISPGGYLEVPQITEALVIHADQPVSVAQFTPSQTCDNRNPRDDNLSPFYEPLYPGDPDMVILSPIEQNLRQITLYSSSAQDITDNYINVIIAKEDVPTFTLDGSTQVGQFREITGNTTYAYARFRVSAGTHRLSAGGGFNAIAYGYGNYESYAYLGGTNLLDFSKHITHETGPEIYTGSESCSGRTVRFSAELDFEVYSFQWDFGDGTVSGVETELEKLLSYEHTYAGAGNYTAKLVILKSDGSECGDAERLEIPYELQVSPNPFPEPVFHIPPSCVEDLVQFENLSSIADGTAMTYEWDFGDGSPVSGEANPLHKFSQPGIYQVSLSAISKYGCRQQLSQEITINAADPSAEFTLAEAICQNETALFSDQSTVSLGEVTRWHWDFNGEGSSAEKDPSFRFATPGLKTITLTAYTGENCFDVEVREMTVLPSPEPVFTLSREQAVVCVNTPPFTLSGFSPLNGHLGGQGQLAAAAGLDENGIFYPALAGAGSHEVFYTYTNAEGCSQTVSQVILVQELPVVNAGNDQRILEGKSADLNAGSSGIRFEWTPSHGLDNPFSLDPRAAPDTTTVYTLTAWNEAGCMNTDEVKVEVLRFLRIPGMFTPNNDGTNDRWIIGNIEDYPRCLVQIFNRFGERVFHSQGYPEPWNGDLGNKLLPPATYYYVIRPNEAHPRSPGR